MKLREKPEVIFAWLNGETVQYKNAGEWGDFPKSNNVPYILLDDAWDDFRIKPKDIVTTTYIQFDKYNAPLHSTFSRDSGKHNLRLTWGEDGITLLKAEAI